MAKVGDFMLDPSAELGTGGYGKVVTAKNTLNDEKVAAKIISTSRMKESAIDKEVGLMDRLGKHPNIVGLKGREKHGKNMIIFMELAEKGELFSRVINAGVLTEDDARKYFTHVMEAVKYMHQNGVVHRDLKLENVLLDAADVAKVCDFGLAHVFEADPAKGEGAYQLRTLREVCGSKSYCAPEVLDGRGYDGYPTDVWSCGICLFAMLAGFFPLDEASGADWRFERAKMAASSGASVTHTIFGFYDRPCTLSREVTDLIDGMLVVDPSRRLTVEQVLQSPWVLGQTVGVQGGAVYRGGPLDMSREDALKLLAIESDEPMAPVYRGAPKTGPPQGPPPLLRKQEPMFCADFMLEE